MICEVGLDCSIHAAIASISLNLKLLLKDCIEYEGNLICNFTPWKKSTGR
jgi:hypothetical protein